MKRTQNQGKNSGETEEPVGRDLDFQQEKNDGKKNEQEARIVHRQGCMAYKARIKEMPPMTPGTTTPGWESSK